MSLEKVALARGPLLGSVCIVVTKNNRSKITVDEYLTALLP